MKAGFSLKLALLITLTIAYLALIPSAKAQSTDDLSGRYQCAQAKVGGKVVPCAGALNLKSDGRFELRGWEGSYLVNGQWVELSDSSVRSRARIEPGHKIVFRYRGKHGWCEMTYERKFAELGKTALS